MLCVYRRGLRQGPDTLLSVSKFALQLISDQSKPVAAQGHVQRGTGTASGYWAVRLMP